MTTLSRRDILKGAAAFSGAALLARTSIADTTFPALRATPATAQLAPAG